MFVSSVSLIQQAIGLLEKANSDLRPERISGALAQELLEQYARAEKLASFGKTALAAKVSDPEKLARVTGTSFGKAKDTVATGKVLAESSELSDALRYGEVSLDQAAEIAKAEESAPGVAKELINVAQSESFQVLKDRARKAKLDADQHNGLAERQRRLRRAKSYVDADGMVNIPLKLEPHIGTPIVNRAEAEAKRFAKQARAEGRQESFDCHLADAYAKMLAGHGKPSTTRPEMVVVVSHEVAQRGWNDVKRGEVCKIPGVGPISPRKAKEIAEGAMLNIVVSDGKDLRHFKRFTRYIPKEIQIALELGDPPDFDGLKCTGCGTRVGLEIDHVEPRAARGPTSKPNLLPECMFDCHPQKTARDRRAGKLTRAGPRYATG